MFSVIKTKPLVEPVNLTEMKTYLRVDESEDDSLIQSLIAAATRKVEAHINRKLISQEWEIFWDRFPSTSRNMWWDGTKDMAISELVSSKRTMDIPFGPMQSVSSFYTYDNDNTAYLFDPANYILDNSGPFGRIALKLGSTWPTTVLRPINGIKITGIFGYGAAASDVPEDIKLAIKILVSNMYEHRGDDEAGKMPTLCMTMLEPFKQYMVPRG
jgi:uncharacterized phiE125 gp8 family phage protein